MSDLKNEARDALENAKEKAGNVFESLKDKAVEWKDKAAPAVESLKDKAVEWKDKAAPAVESLKDKAVEWKDKAAPAVESLKDKAAGAVESVKRGRSRTAAGDVKNELFDGLEAQALQQQRSAQQEAEDMQRRLEALMRGEPASAPDAEEPDADETRED